MILKQLFFHRSVSLKFNLDVLDLVSHAYSIALCCPQPSPHSFDTAASLYMPVSAGLPVS